MDNGKRCSRKPLRFWSSIAYALEIVEIAFCKWLSKSVGLSKFIMTISDSQWRRWLDLLEDILHEADVNQEFLFGIHINAAIGEVRLKLDTAMIVPREDQLSDHKRNS